MTSSCHGTTGKPRYTGNSLCRHLVQYRGKQYLRIGCWVGKEKTTESQSEGPLDKLEELLTLSYILGGQ